MTFECGDHGGTELTYDWDFGDGNTQSLYETTSATHLFATPGLYTVSLFAYNMISDASHTQSES